MTLAVSTTATPVNRDKGRVAYAVAGQAQRQAIVRALEGNLTKQELQVFLVTLDLTASWSKLSVRVYVEEIRLAAGVPYTRTCDILRKLDGLGVIRFRSSRVRGRPSTLSLPEPVGYSATGHPTASLGTPVEPVGYPATGYVPSSTEKNVVEWTLTHEADASDSDEPGAFTKAIASLSPTPNQRRELLAHFTKNETNFLAALEVALREGEKPVAYLLTTLRAGAHLEEVPVNVSGASDATLKARAAHSWYENVGRNEELRVVTAELDDRVAHGLAREVADEILEQHAAAQSQRERM